MNWQQQMCPILSAQMLAKPKPVVALAGAAGPPEPEVMACQGPACMWFMQIRDPDSGKIVGGTCVATLIPNALSQLTGTISNVADRMIPTTKEGN